MNENPEDPQDPQAQFSEAAVEAFTGFLSRVQEGEAPDVEKLCSEHPESVAELRRLYASWQALAGMMSQLGPAPHGSASRIDVTAVPEGDPEFLRRFFKRLEASKPELGRYRMGAQVAGGGQGTVLRVFDEHLRRPLAMKVMLGAGALPATGATPPIEQRKQGRFLEEAQVTSQLDHPSIVPVHELGLDADGKLYFTMKLVRGRDLHEVIEHVHDASRAGRTEWTLERTLEILLKVCDAVAFAHSKGVVHRDLKPANVMVGQFGEVYVIDWGMARVLGREDVRDIRLTSQPPADGVSSERKAHADDTPGAALYTQDGDVVGTLNYMPPEQAAGRSAEVGPRSDVYSTGAVLYHILAGRKPYDGAAARTVQEVRDSVLAEPPTPLAELAPDTQEELLAICEKAMSREPAERYADMREMAGDVRAYLEGRVVQAHRTGPVPELRKWVRRNRTVAALAASLIGFIVVASILFGVQASRENAKTRLMLELADLQTARQMIAAVNEIRPSRSDCPEKAAEWLQTTAPLRARADGYLRELAALRSRGTRMPPGEGGQEARILLEIDRLEGHAEGLGSALTTLERTDPQPATVHSLRILDQEIEAASRGIASLRREADLCASWSFEDPDSTRRHKNLSAVCHALFKLFDPGVGAELRVIQRRDQAQQSIASPEDWTSVRGVLAESPLYAGVDLPPQFGLAPLGTDPTTGLFEFWHVFSGARPTRGADGSWDIQDETGIVLVLIPGGTFRMGDSAFGTLAEEHDVTLAPYFISKYELTQAQWIRATGENPSTFAAGQDYSGPRISRTHPVETVGWDDASAALELWGLELPTEAQWERAARGGRAETYWWGDALRDVVNPVRENFFDVSAGGPAEYDDGWQLPAPVNELRPNPYGLFHAVGNVSEWCKDWSAHSMVGAIHAPGTGELITADRTVRSFRGVSFKGRATSLSPGLRQSSNPEAREDSLGVRPARRIEP